LENHLEQFFVVTAKILLCLSKKESPNLYHFLFMYILMIIFVSYFE
jgi:hypothetical protein